MEYRRYATPVDTNLRPMSTPLGEKTLAAVPAPLNHLAADFDPGYECLEGGPRHRAAPYLLAPPQERLVQLGGLDAVVAFRALRRTKSVHDMRCELLCSSQRSAVGSPCLALDAVQRKIWMRHGAARAQDEIFGSAIPKAAAE
jgi:hypothetical protein